jgi:hypothetical protein
VKTKLALSIMLVFGSIGVARADGSQLLPGEYLFPGQRLTAPGCYYHLEMQGDGNLVSYDQSWNPLWWSSTQGLGAYVVMQRDGNLVIYNKDDIAVWASNTYFAPGSSATQQADGNLVVYAPSGPAVWNSGVVDEVLGSSVCETPPVKTLIFGGNLPGDNQSVVWLVNAGMTPTTTTCALLCVNNALCQAFTLVNGICSMKSGIPKWHPLAGAVSGMIIR